MRGFTLTFPCFLVFSRVFSSLWDHIQACPLITLRKSRQKVAFGHKSQLLTLFSQSDEWGRLILMPKVSFSREKLTIPIRRKWCIPISFSGKKKCVKGGVFFPIQKCVFLATLWPESGSGQFSQIQAALAYPC